MKKPKTSKKKSNKIIKILFLVSLILLPFTCFFYSASFYIMGVLFAFYFSMDFFFWLMSSCRLFFSFCCFLRRGFPPKVFLIAPDTLTITCIAVGICLFGLDSICCYMVIIRHFENSSLRKSMNSLHYQDIATYLYPDSLIEKVVNKKIWFKILL